MNNKINGFTLSEVLITLVIIGVIAAMTIPTLIARYEEQVTVSRVQKAYSTIANAWAKFQADNGCTGTVEGCLRDDETNSSQNSFHDRFLKYINTAQKIPTNTSLSSYDWLPDSAYHLNGDLISQFWMGVHRASTGRSSHFALSDGTICSMEFPDTYRQSGYIFIDTNGKKGPNRIGKDQFPIGIGAYNNPQYAGIVHPYYAEDNTTTGGLCVIRNNGQCSPDICTKTNCSPTAYILKHKKLPPINW